MIKAYSQFLSSKKGRRKSRASTIQSLSGVVSSTSDTTSSFDEKIPDNITWTHSHPIDYNDENRKGCFTSLPIRIHKNDHVAERGSQRFMQDLAAMALVVDGPTTCRHGAGCLSSPVGNYAAFLYPECLPDRLEVVAYLVELGYLRDYQAEKPTEENAAEQTSVSIESTKKEAMEKLLSKAMSELTDINHQPLGKEIIETYRNNWLASMEKPTNNPTDLDNYVIRRRASAGFEIYWTLLAFSLGTQYTQEDQSIMQPIVDAAERTMIFTNDYYSWTREKFTATTTSSLSSSSGNTNTNVSNNVIPFLMRHEGLTEDDAKGKTKQLVLQMEQEFLKRQGILYQEYPNLSPRLRIWAEVLGSVIGGVHYWCANSPRYVVVAESDDGIRETEMSEDPKKKNKRKEEEEGEKQKIVVKEERDNETAPLTPISLSDGENGVESPEKGNDVVEPTEPEQEEVKPNTQSQHEPEPEILTPLSDTDADTFADANSSSNRTKLESIKLLAPITYAHFITTNNTTTTTVINNLIEALNIWLQVPSRPLNVIKQAITDLNTSFHIIDDIHDGPQTTATTQTPTHLVMGTPQSSNSATYTFIRTTQLITHLNCPGMLDAVLENLEAQFIGRSWELEWRFFISATDCPSEQEYMDMVDKKTGSIFRMAVKTMQSACMKGSGMNLDSLSTLLGRWWHLRAEYLSLLLIQEGKEEQPLCSILDQGKISYPILKCCNADPTAKMIIQGIFRQSRIQQQQQHHHHHHHHHHLSTTSKTQIMKFLYRTGAMQQTYGLIQRLTREIEKNLGDLESAAQEEKGEEEKEEPNLMIRSLVRSLGGSSGVPVPRGF